MSFSQGTQNIIRFPVCVLVFVCFVLGSSCEKPSPLTKALRERMRYEIELQSWAIMEDRNIVANIRVSGPTESSIDYLTIRFDQFDAEKNPMKTNWIPIDLAELSGTGSKDLTVILECGNEKVSLLTADLDYQPQPQDMDMIKELKGMSRQ